MTTIMQDVKTVRSYLKEKEVFKAQFIRVLPRELSSMCQLLNLYEGLYHAAAKQPNKSEDLKLAIIWLEGVLNE